jgi:hypothetical protein
MRAGIGQGNELQVHAAGADHRDRSEARSQRVSVKASNDPRRCDPGRSCMTCGTATGRWR